MSYLYQLASTIGVGVISFGLSLLIARQVGASNFGQYSIALAIGSILAIFIDGGFRNLLTRERTRISDHLQEISPTLTSAAMGHSLIVALLASFICILAFPNHLQLGLSTIWCFWAAVITQYASAVLRGDGHLKKDAFWQLKQRALTALIISAAITMGFFQAWQLLLAWLIGALTANLLLGEGFRLAPTFRLLLVDNLKLYRVLLPLLWIDLATAIYFRSDLIMLGILKISDADIGRYASAYRLIEAAILIATPLSIIIFRRVRLLHIDHILQSRYVLLSIALALLFGLLFAVFMSLFSTQLIYFFYGPEYGQAAELLSILAWMILLLIPNTVLTQTALALNLEKNYAVTATLAAAVNITINLIYIPQYGTIATAYSSILTELVLLLGLSFCIWKKLKKNI